MHLNSSSLSDNFTGQSIEDKSIQTWSVLFIIVIAIVGHTFVFLAMYRNRHLRTIPNIIILNLSVADFLFNVIVPLTQVVRLFRRETYLTTIPCNITGVAGLLFCLTSNYTLTFVSIERYMATNYPLQHRRRFTHKLIKSTLAIIWVWSALLSVFPFLTSKYVYIKRFSHCSIDWADDLATTISFVVLGIVLPQIVLVYCNVHVVLAIRKSQLALASSLAAGSSRDAERRRHQRERNISMMMIAVVVTFAVCWAPYCAAMVCLAIIRNCQLSENFMSLALISSMLNSCCNPIIYGLLNKKFRTAFWNIICIEKIQILESANSHPT